MNDYKNNGQNQLIYETPEGESNLKLVLDNVRWGDLKRGKLSVSDPVRLEIVEQQINSVTGAEIGEPTLAPWQPNTTSERFAVALAQGAEGLASLVCDLWVEHNAPAEQVGE
jgi:hypothetical protein